MDIFSENKQKVREMNRIVIEKFFTEKKRKLRYLGLPSEGMVDIECWRDLLEHVSAVERGVNGEEWVRQHNIILKAFIMGISNNFLLYRGDIDNILIEGRDSNNQLLKYPYDLVNLDYCGGVIYKEAKDRSRRIESLKCLFDSQAKLRSDFLLILTCNFDNDINEECRQLIDKMINSVSPEIRFRIKESYTDPSDIVKLKVVFLSLIQDIAKEHFGLDMFKPIYYKGNKDTNMINFSMKLNYVSSRIGERKVKYSPLDILDFPTFTCDKGVIN